MKLGDIIVVRLSGNISVRRVLSVEGQRIRVALGRNREGRVPKARVALETNLEAENEGIVDMFRERCAEIEAEIDLSEVWEIARDTTAALVLNEVADLYWTKERDISYKVALLLLLERPNPYFESKDGRYLARPPLDVEKTLARRYRQAEHAAAMEALAKRLIDADLRVELDEIQRDLLIHLRGFVVHGDNYTKAALAKQLLQQVSSTSQNQQKMGFDLLVKAGMMSEDEPLELERAEVVEEFSDIVMLEAEAIDLPGVLETDRRRDLTGMPTFTIDEEDTRDRDDAISVQETEDGFLLGLHIADAGSLITQYSALDIEADRRMATVYMPDRRVPMLPPVLSEGLGSLEPGQRRVALSLLANISKEGDLGDWDVVPSIVCSDGALSYSEANRQLCERNSDWHLELTSLNRLATMRRKLRAKAGAVMIERPDFNVTVSKSGNINVGVISRNTASRRLVTELMILCNALLAEFCVNNGLSVVYRSQPTHNINIGSIVSTSRCEDAENRLREFVTIRQLPPVTVSTTPAPHGGLGVKAYIQATSPLRRYPDLVTQRQISQYLIDGKVRYSEMISSLAARADLALKEIARLEDTRRRYWFLKYLLHNRASPDSRDASTNYFRAVVLENSKGRSALVELEEYPFRTRVDLTKEVCLGGRVLLRLQGVDLWTRTGRFVHVS